MKKIIGIMILGLSNTFSFGMDIIPANSHYYYELGGGSDIVIPPVTRQQKIIVGGNVGSDLGFNCSSFNPAVSVSNTINDLEDSVQGVGDNVIGSATGAVASLPMYLLSKSNKDLYNLIQNAMAGAEESFNLSMKSCQDAMGQIKNGKSPYEDWFGISDSQGWLQAANRAKTEANLDINDSKKSIGKDSKAYGIPWVHSGENSGGTTGSQVPIKVIYDVVVAGYNVLVDPSLPLDQKSTASTLGSGLALYWNTADDAGNWARTVMGDITISSQKGEGDQTARGIGLMGLIQSCPQLSSDRVKNNLTCADEISKNLQAIIQETGRPTAVELKSVSSPELMVTPALIQSIRNRTPEEQALAIGKWSQDVSVQNAVNEALMMRRILIAGSQTKPVRNLTPALQMVNETLDQLDKDVKDILFQVEVQKMLMTSTAEFLMSDESAHEAVALNEKSQSPEPHWVNGSVYSIQGKTP